MTLESSSYVTGSNFPQVETS